MTDFAGSNTPKEHRDLWQTPPEIFAALNAEFHFQLDAAASSGNALCTKFITQQQNTLETKWGDFVDRGYVWLNPPYSQPLPFIRKAALENDLNFIGCVMLLPADTSVSWFKEAVSTASEVRLIAGGRLAFVSSESGKPVSGNSKGSMLIIWHPWPRTHCAFSICDRDALMSFGRECLRDFR